MKVNSFASVNANMSEKEIYQEITKFVKGMGHQGNYNEKIRFIDKTLNGYNSAASFLEWCNWNEQIAVKYKELPSGEIKWLVNCVYEI